MNVSCQSIQSREDHWIIRYEFAYGADHIDKWSIYLGSRQLHVDRNLHVLNYHGHVVVKTVAETSSRIKDKSAKRRTRGRS